MLRCLQEPTVFDKSGTRYCSENVNTNISLPILIKCTTFFFCLLVFSSRRLRNFMYEFERIHMGYVVAYLKCISRCLTGEWRQLHNEELYYHYFPPDIILMVK